MELIPMLNQKLGNDIDGANQLNVQSVARYLHRPQLTKIRVAKRIDSRELRN